MAELFPYCRSITGDGVRQTLQEVAARIPLDIHEVPSGSKVLDWLVPDEWNIRDAYVASSDGERVVDFGASNLHVVSYSAPVRRQMALTALHPHLHTHTTNPDWIPYRTSYYEHSWGFCLSRRVLESLVDDDYEVVIDSTLEAGSLTYGELMLEGEIEDEVLLTTHICHPSLANDNLSGIALLTELGAHLAERRRRLTYRLLFIPGTIGSITWLARNEDRVSYVVAGVVVACVGDPAPLTYKRSRRANTLVDRAAAHVLSQGHDGARIVDFEPWGWDERQFNSPGFDLPVGSLSRSREGQYAEYHSSGDNLDLVSGARLEEALEAMLAIVDVLEQDRRLVNQFPKGEPQLGRRGLYPGMGGGDPKDEQLAMLWLLNGCDGTASILDVAERSSTPFSILSACAKQLEAVGLLAEADTRS